MKSFTIKEIQEVINEILFKTGRAPTDVSLSFREVATVLTAYDTLLRALLALEIEEGNETKKASMEERQDI